MNFTDSVVTVLISFLIALAITAVCHEFGLREGLWILLPVLTLVFCIFFVRIQKCNKCG
jgi:hypothetical protein